jgi:hypothetical protein
METINSIKKLLPNNIMATDEQIQESIDYHYGMVEKYKNKEVVYFLGNKTDTDFILQNLSSNLYYNFCKNLKCVGYTAIMNLLKLKKIPEPIVDFYIKNRNGGSEELEIIEFVYGISQDFTKEELKEIKRVNGLLEAKRGKNESNNPVLDLIEKLNKYDINPN